jgi:hypothetical protein
VQQLICDDGDDDDASCQLAILPTPFSVDPRTGPLDGPGGLAGRDGTGGADGVAAPTAPTWLGAGLTGPVIPGACDGRDGTAGTPGGDGSKGRNGGTSKIAEITIGELTGSLTLVATAGRGGDGGSGGDGGRGGDGGHGADGQRTLQGILRPGHGGDGGTGGDGGRAGRGGDGGISSDVFVSLPPGQEGRLRVLAHPSAGGRGGLGGLRGPGGRPGRAGAKAPVPGIAVPGIAVPGIAVPGSPGPGTPAPITDDPVTDGPVTDDPVTDDLAPAASGRDGTVGARAHDGRARSAPPVFVNERLAEPMPSPTAIRPPDPVRPLDTRAAGPAAHQVPPPPSERITRLATEPATEGEQQ